MGKRFIFVAVLLLVSLVASQTHQQQRSVGGGAKNTSVTRNRETSSRMISSNSGAGGGSRVNHIPGGDDGDSSFDNGPAVPGRDSSEITFPETGDDLLDTQTPRPAPAIGNRSGMHTNSTATGGGGGHGRAQIPLSALVKFGTESNLESFFEKYVQNTKVTKDNETQEVIVTDAQGKPILDPKQDKVDFPEPRVFEPMTRAGLNMQSVPFGTIGGGIGKGRKGGVNLETTARIGLDQAARGKQSGISLPVCTPEVTTVPVPLNELKVDPDQLVVPKCFKVKRCGGCCLSDLTVCEPDTKENVQKQVTVLGYVGDKDGMEPKLQFLSTAMVNVEQHKTCKCKCRTKKEHCKSRHHIYEESMCSCKCRNQADRQRCEEHPENRFWDNDTCQCTCQEVKVCSSGFYFDLNSCDCQRVPVELETRARKLPPAKTGRK